ncbi:MAG: LptE family protein [Bacteroidales bacterium]|nr:LptE family protein [Bacteroidales bacterium]
MKKIISYTSLVSVLFLLTACFSMKYSFTGASIDPALKTVSVQFFNNRAPIIEPGLDQKITESLKDYLESNTSLRLVNGVGDVDFYGEITGYNVSSTAIGAGDQPAKDRFTISIKVVLTNSVQPELDFDSSFSRFREFDSNVNFESVKEGLTKEIIDEIVEQVFNKAFVNW